ncbi:MAG: trypsin-like serine protease [Phycisphaerae bacterium]
MRSTKLRLGAWITLLAVWMVGSPAHGGAGRHDRPKERYVEFAKQFPAVGSVYGLGTGTLVAPEWVVTCAHGIEIIDKIVRDKSRHTVRLAGKEYKIAGVVHHPDRKHLTMAMMAGKEEEAEDQNDHDILLLRLADPVTDVEPLGLYTGEGESGLEAVFAGCGSWIPDGRVGVSLAKADAGKRGEPHAGTNRIDRINASGRLEMSFTAPDEGATDLEIGFSAGDSGGPMLIQDRGKWKVAGVASMSGDLDISKGVGRYGDQILGTRVSKYADWIRSTIRGNPAGK